MGIIIDEIVDTGRGKTCIRFMPIDDKNETYLGPEKSVNESSLNIY